MGKKERYGTTTGKTTSLVDRLKKDGTER